MTTTHAPAYARETWQTLEPYHGVVYLLILVSAPAFKPGVKAISGLF